MSSLKRVKRVFDLVVSVPALILLAPLLIGIGLAVFVSMGRPILFVQSRAGWRGAPFRLIKFRTMTNERDPEGRMLPDNYRLTKIGTFLRRTTLDELPELINVLCGDMSIVGPRPLLLEYLERYSPKQSRRHEVKPGLTGWAVVSGRNALSWEEKFRHDVWYVDHWSLALDLKILALTALQVLKRQGVNAPGHATMPEFAGSKETQR